MDDNHINNYQLYQEDHQNIKDILKEYINKISLIVFKAIFLGDKTIKSKDTSTIKAINKSLELLNNKGKILITVYPGHDEGLKESMN